MVNLTVKEKPRLTALPDVNVRPLRERRAAVLLDFAARVNQVSRRRMEVRRKIRAYLRDPEKGA